MSLRKLVFLAVALLATAASTANAAMFITEWMYTGETDAAEFIEFTNVGASPIDMTGWSYSDDGDVPGEVDLSTFGVVAPGESVVLAEATALVFRGEWGLPASVKVIGENMVNLSRNDEINLYDDLGQVVDRLTYGDQNIPGTIRANAFSGNPGSLAALGANDVSQWVLSEVGDRYGSVETFSIPSDVGNPGSFAIPEPASACMLMLGLVAGMRRLRK